MTYKLKYIFICLICALPFFRATANGKCHIVKMAVLPFVTMSIKDSPSSYLGGNKFSGNSDRVQCESRTQITIECNGCRMMLDTEWLTDNMRKMKASNISLSYSLTIASVMSGKKALCLGTNLIFFISDEKGQLMEYPSVTYTLIDVD